MKLTSTAKHQRLWFRPRVWNFNFLSCSLFSKIQ